MFALIKLDSRWGKHRNAVRERCVFRNHFLAFGMLCIGMPCIVLAAVCVCTAAVVLPIAFLFHWM